MSKNQILLFILVIAGHLACAEEDSLHIAGSWSMGIKAQSGFLIAHRPSLVYLQKGRTKALEISYLKSSNGTKDWQAIYNYPLYGFAYQFINLGNPENLGNAHALYSLIFFPLFHKHHLRLNIRLGVGIGYVEKRFNLDDNYKNQAVGSHLNGVVTSGLQLRIFSKYRTQLNTGIDFTHFSNGSSKLPNLGLNIPSVNIGINHFFGDAVTLERKPLPAPTHGKEIMIYIAGGIKELYPPEGPKYGIAVLAGDVHWKIGHKSLVGVGPDIFYDETLKYRIASLDSVYLTAFKANFRAGIHGSYGLVIGQLNAFFQTGFYLYNRLPEEASIYSRLALRFFVSKHVFVCMNLKTHYGKADYFETGLGYKL